MSRFWSSLKTQTDPKLVALLRRPLPEILKELSDTDRHVKGLALEALAFKIMRLLDMDYVATRLRGAQTGGAEVDLVFQSARLVFSRWQIQCKNTPRVALDDVAKEVGLNPLPEEQRDRNGEHRDGGTRSPPQRESDHA